MNHKGMVHSVVFILVIIIGFGFALGWPQYAKYREVSRAKEALAQAVRLGEAQKEYAASHEGEYAGNWEDFALPLTCPQVVRDGVYILECPHYHFYLQEGKIYARHNDIAKWFTYDITTGDVDCAHETQSVAGSKICEKVIIRQD